MALIFVHVSTNNTNVSTNNTNTTIKHINNNIKTKSQTHNMFNVITNIIIIIIINHFYIALFSALEQTHCARMWFYMSEYFL